MTKTERFYRFLGFYISRSGILHTKTWFAKFMSDNAVIDGNFIYLGKNMYKVNKE
jgi:hypothetical protein